MLDPNTLAEGIKTLGSLASMVSAYLAIRRERRELLDRDKEEIVRAGGKGVGYILASDFLNLMKVIPDGVLDAWCKRIKKAQERYERAILRPTNTLDDLNREKEIVAEEVCYALATIKEHNKGELPDGELKDKWDAFQCDFKS